MMDVPTFPGPVESGLKRVVDLAKDDLARRLSISVDQIEVLEAKSVVWPDGSLGCPHPGVMYTQALVPGYQVVLGVGNGVFDYHASKTGSLVLCPEGLAEEGLPPGSGRGPLVDR